MGEHDDFMAFTNAAAAASWMMFTIAAITFFLRTISRIWFVQSPGIWEDVIISVSWLLDIVRMVTLAIALDTTRQVDVNNPMQTVPLATFWAIVTNSWCFLSMYLPKIAVALLLIRVFRPRPWIRKSLLYLSVGLFGMGVVGCMLCFLQCWPVQGGWDPFTYPNVQCWPREFQIYYALLASSTSSALDLLFAVYPAFVISSLHIETWKKLTTIPLMGIGLTAFATGIIKVAMDHALLNNPDIYDVYGEIMGISMWNSIENDLVIIGACLPLVPAIFKGRKLNKARLYPGSPQEKT